jgi:hypothetical protein
MTAPSSIDPARFLHEHLASASPDLLRSMLMTFINTLMSAEADAVCGAGYGERSDERTNVRNGYRHRDFDTRAGTLDVAIPKLRSGSYFPDNENDQRGIELRPGDIVMVRTGARRRREQLGPWDPHNFSAGLHPGAVPFLHDHDVAVLGADGDSDAQPSPVEGIQSPIHALVLTAMGMPLIDNMNLEDLSRTCAELRRWEFLCTIAPLRIPGGTGSPLNPIAVF